MFYIITYATHSERYFELLKKYPGIIILGWGKKWGGFYDKANAVLDFCKSKKHDDIVCFVDGFDSVILADTEKIMETYKSFNKELVFSKEVRYFNVMHKYLLDKIFSRCQNVTINSGLYMGTCRSIIDFWSNITKEDDDQTYANRMCRLKNIYIDKDFRLFYNHTNADTVEVKNNGVYVFHNPYSTCIVSCPGNENMNEILKKLGYHNLPEIKYNFYYRVKTYYKHFIIEFLFVLFLFGLYFIIKDKFISFLSIFILFFVLLHYQIYTKHLEVSCQQKIMYTLIDIVHLGVFAVIIYLIFNCKCNLYKLLLLNCIYLSLLLSFFLFKRCILTVLQNKVLQIDEKYGMIGIHERINYLRNNEYMYEKKECILFHDFIEVNKIFIFLVLLVNVICFIKIQRSMERQRNAKLNYVAKRNNLYVSKNKKSK